MQSDAVAQAQQQRPMENEKESTKNPQRDQRAATPISIVETRLAISAHAGLTLPDEGKAQIQPNLANHSACDQFKPIGYVII